MMMLPSQLRTCLVAASITWLMHGSPSGTTAAPAIDDLPWQVLPSGGPELENPVEVRRVRDMLTEREDDAVEARALFMQGRLLLERRNFSDALRCYERAWRFDPMLVSVIREIVPLAASLNREAEATRYAIIAAEQENNVPPALVQRVAAILASRLEFQRALRIYQRFGKQHREDPDRFMQLLGKFEIGRLALLTGDAPGAANAFTEVRAALLPGSGTKLSPADRKKLMPKPEAAYALMAEAFLRANRLAEAESMFRLANQARPNTGLLAYQLARIAAARDDRPAALKQLQKYFDAKLASGGVAPYVLLANLMTPTSIPAPSSDAQARPAKVPAALLEKLTALVKADPDNAMLGYFYADQLRAAGKLQLAEQQYRKLLKYKPAADAYQGLVRVYMAQRQVDALLRTLGQVVLRTSSLDAIEPAIQQITSDRALLHQLVNRVQPHGEKTKKAVPEGALGACALLQLVAKDYKSADTLFQAAMRQAGPGHGPLAIEFALRMMAADQPAPAVGALRQIIDQKLMSDKQAELYHALAGAEAMANHVDAAIAAAREAAKLAPDSPRMFARLGWVYYYAKKLQPAETRFLQLLDRFDGDRDSEETRLVLRDARQMLSSICVDQERPRDAEAWLLQILDEYPADIGASNDLGYLWCDQGIHLHRALAMIRRAIDAEPDNIAYRDSLGWAFYRLGRYEQAVTELEKATAKEPADGVILDHLGDAYAKAGRPDKARATWKKAADQLRAAQATEKADRIRAKIAKSVATRKPKRK